MAEPILKHVALSMRQIATETGFDRATVRKRIDHAGIKPAGKRGGFPVYRLRDVLPALYFGVGEEFDPDKLKPVDRHAHYKAEREKLHLQIERGDLVPSIEVEQQFASLFKIVTQGLETLPDVLERDTGATPVQLARIEMAIDEIRDALYALIVEDDADSAAEDSA